MPYSTTINSFRFSLVLLGFLALVTCGGVDEVALPINEAPTASSVNITDANGGDAVVGDDLTGNYVYADAEDDAEGASIFRWLRKGSVIGGATASTYTLTLDDIGQPIIFEVTPVAISGAIGATTGALTGTAIASVAFVPNSSPIANAGADQTPLVNDTVTLDGSGSSDGDGDGLTYSWSFTSVPAGSLAALSDSIAVGPSFAVDLPGTYIVQLIVNDGMVDSIVDTVTIDTDNSAPMANAGTDQSALFGDTVTLNGSASSDVDGDGLTYNWSFTSRPALSTVILTGSTTLNPTFAIDVSGDYVVQLIVNDGMADSAPDTVIISTNNSAPVANAGADQATLVSDMVTLDGSTSSDVDGDLLTYSWSFSSKPALSLATLSDSTAVSPTFAVDLPGTYVMQLIVNDGTVDSAPDIVSISTDNSPPVANAGPDQAAFFGNTMTLDGSGSSDVDGDGLTYSWSFTSRPTGSTAILTGSTTLNPTFRIDVSGDYVVQLIVNDGTVDSAPDTVSISTNNSAPVANAGADQTPLVNETVTLDGSASSDVDGDGLTFRWSFSSFPAGSTAALSDTTAVTPTFTVDLPGTYVVQLIVNDGTVNSDPVTVTIITRNSAPVANAGGPYTVDEGATISLDANGSSDLDGDPLSYAWDLDNDGAFDDAVGATVFFSRNDNGLFSVAVEVSDGLLTSIATANVTVSNVVPTVEAGPNQSVNEGVSVSFTGSFNDPAGTADTYTVKWNFGDGSPEVIGTLTPSHTYADNGIYTVTLTVTDDDGGVGSDTLIVTVSNVVPTVEAGPNQSVNEGVSVSFTGSFSDPAGTADTYTVKWNFGDGSPEVIGTLTPSHTYADNGIYIVTLTVTDDDGGVGSDTLIVMVSNVVPTVEAGPNQSVNEGVRVSFTGSFSDPAGTADTYTVKWNFGDGSPEVIGTLTPSHTYADNGIYTVTLTVTDADGGVGSDTLIVTVRNVVPTVEAGPNQSVNEGVSVSFTGSFSDPAGTADTYTVKWNFADGSPEVIGTLTPSHTYAANGIYTVTLTVTDDDGGVGSDTLIVTVSNVVPTVEAGPNQSVNEGVSVSFTGSFSDPAGTADTYTVKWNFADGSPEVIGTLTPSHTYADNGIYTVTLTVTDADGGVGSDTLIVTVSNVVPTVEAGPNQSVNEGVSVSFTGSFNDPAGTADTYTVKWNFADGSPEVIGTLTPSHTYADNGIYTVTLTVTDDDGGVGSDTLIVTVSNVVPTVEAGPNQSVNEGVSVSFTGSFSDPAGTADTYIVKWSFGDGSPEVIGTLTPSHTYADNGIYTVTLTVTDDDGGVGSDTLIVTVSNVVPTVEAGPNQSVNEGVSVSFIGSFNDPAGTADTYTVKWNFADGSPEVIGTLTPSHTYADNGIYTVTLTVTDGDGGVGSDTLIVTVSNVVPTVEAGPNQSVNTGDTVSFTGTFSDPGTDTYTNEWNFGDGSPVVSGTLTPSHTYAVAGPYTVTLTVTDDDGGVGNDTLIVTVSNVNVAPVADAGGPYTVNEGVSVLLDANGSSDPDGDTLSYAWDLNNDGTFDDAGGAIASFSRNDNDSFNVAVEVSDGLLSSRATAVVTVNDLGPTAVLSGASSLNEGQPGSYDASGTTSSPDTIVLYNWDFGDGSPVESGILLTILSHAYADNGIYTVTLTVTDDDGSTDVTSMNVTVNNVVPIADAGTDQSVNTGDTVSFTGTFSDPGTDTHTEEWNFGDGSPFVSGTLTPSHTYTVAGPYTVTLTVTDDDGGIGSDTLIVTVNNVNVAPVADAGGPYTVNEGASVSLDANGSSDPNGDLLSFAWDLDNDGTFDDAGGAIASFSRNDNGSFNVAVEVSDGLLSSRATAVATVNDLGPTAVLSGASILNEGQPGSYDASGTTSSPDTIVLYNWDFGDGSPVESGILLTILSHAYADNGIYTVTLTVTDDDDSTDITSMNVTVNNVVPTVNAGTDQSVNTGVSVSFTGTFSDPGTGDTHTNEWSFGDSSPVESGTLTPSHAYAATGIYTVTLTVTDDDGGIGSDTLIVTVI